MRYSEAIRLGSMLRLQGFGYQHQQGSGSCANNAAIEASGAKNVFEAWPWAEVVVPCPVCSKTVHPGFARGLHGTVAHLNDIHRWTRERIADWVEEQENLYQPQSIVMGQIPSVVTIQG